MGNIAVQYREAVEALLTITADALTLHRNDVYPQEAVGIICSDGSTYPLINQARSPHRFEVSQSLVVEAIDMLNEANMNPIAVYHSHPDSVSGPSERDILLLQAMNGALSVIVGIDGISGWIWDDQPVNVGSVPLPGKE